MRYQIDGKRYYETPIGKLPSVTTVLSATEDEDCKRRLEGYDKSKLASARDRGTFVHEVIARHIRSGMPWGESDFPAGAFWRNGVFANADDLMQRLSEHRDFITPLKEILQEVEQPLWCEGLMPEVETRNVGIDVDADVLDYINGKDSGIPRLWSSESGGFSGCPDLICTHKLTNQIIVADFKTSESKYYSKFPGGVESEQRRAVYSGVMKYKKTVLQLAAYSLCIKEVLNLQVRGAAIIVATPGEASLMWVMEYDLIKAQEQFLERVKQFHIENPVTENSIFVPSPIHSAS